MGLYAEKCGFGKRKHSVAERKAQKRRLVTAIVKKLKAEKKPVDLQKINQEVYDRVRRKKQVAKPKHAV